MTLAQVIQKIDYHVFPDKRHGWSVRKLGAWRTSGLFSTQRSAAALATKLAGKSGGDVIIHGPSGRVWDRLFGPVCR